MKAWHFLPEDCRLGHGDGRLVRKGETYSVEGKVVLCKNGFHASVSPLDALSYAHGPMLARVELSGEIVEDADKAAASSRTELTERVDVTQELVEFAHWCARRANRYARGDVFNRMYGEGSDNAKRAHDLARIWSPLAKSWADNIQILGWTIAYCAHWAAHAAHVSSNASLKEWRLQDAKLERLFNLAIDERG